MIDYLHNRMVFDGRVKRLGALLAEALPQNARVLDVGCGDGQISRLIMNLRPDVQIEGIDVLARKTSAIPVRLFDGRVIPYESGSVDVVMFVDVLHHIEDPLPVLREACRVARRGLLIKDHNRDGIAAEMTLRMMDWVGNARYGVALPYNYWSSEQWQKAYQELSLRVMKCQTKLRLYSPPLDWIFGRGLHHVTLLEHSSP